MEHDKEKLVLGYLIATAKLENFLDIAPKYKLIEYLRSWVDYEKQKVGDPDEWSKLKSYSMPEFK